MIDEMVLETIEAARKDKSVRVKQASEREFEKDKEKSPIAFNLRKIARSLLDEPVSTTKEVTKTAGDPDKALKGLSLLKKFVGGADAHAS